MLLGHRVAADLRRLGLPDRLPHRAVRPRRQDRHPVRGHHRHPGPGPLLPQDRQGSGTGAGRPVGADHRASSPPRRGNGQLKEERALLQRGLADVGGDRRAPGGAACRSAAPTREDPRQIYAVGLNTTRLLMAMGDVTCAWLLLRGAEVALDRLNDQLSPDEQHFYEGKVASARWFARTVLPKLAAETRDRRGHRSSDHGSAGRSLLNGRSADRSGIHRQAGARACGSRGDCR